MKSRFAFGMFAGFGLACLFFFFFLYFYPSAFRAQAAKKSQTYDVIGYQQVYGGSPGVEYAAPYGASAQNYPETPAPEYQHGPAIVPAPAAPDMPAYKPTAIPARDSLVPATPQWPSVEPNYPSVS